jgi:CheY-like chemotaxis protein
MFEVWGIEGVAFVDGAEAVAWINDVDAGRVQAELPELAILDIRLPEVSGPEVGARLRQSPILGNIAIALITAYSLQPHEEEEVMAQAGADLLLYKPLPEPDEFRRLLENALSRRVAAQDSSASLSAGLA